MVYYNLVSEYEGDITKKCGLTIDEVDNNFYQLEQAINGLKEQQERLETELRYLSVTMHDTAICPPGTSNDATYVLTEGNRHEMTIGGTISYYPALLPDGNPKGNRFGVAIMPTNSGQEYMFPNAKWQINGIPMGSVWDEVNSNPPSWVKAMYLYPKVERIDGNLIVSLAGCTNGNNTLDITIVWDSENTETYRYIVDENVVLEEAKYPLSRTVHDAEINPPGTSNDATYTLDDTGYNMIIGGTIDKDEEHGGNRFGVAVEPLEGVDRAHYPNAKYYINATCFGNLWDEIDRNPEGWPKALFVYPKVERLYNNIVVSVAEISTCLNVVYAEIEWEPGNIETYSYTVNNDVILGNGTGSGN